MSKWEIKKQKGNEEFRRENYTAALGLYTEAIQIDPSQDALYNNRGLTYMKLYKIELAKADLLKAINLNYKNIKALKRLSSVLTSMGNISEANIYLKRCVEIDPSDTSHKDDLIASEDLQSSKEKMQNAKIQKNWATCYELASIFITKCQYCIEIKLVYFESSIRTFHIDQSLNFYKTQFTDDEKQKDEVQYLLSLAYYTDGKYDKAKTTLNILIARNKDENFLITVKELYDQLEKIQADKEKANKCYQLNDFDGAIILYNKLLEMDTNNIIFNATILSNRSLCYYKKRDYFTALHDINSSIKLNDSNWKSYLKRAKISVSLKYSEKAKDDLRKVIELDKGNQEAISLLDDILHEEKKCKRRDFYKILEVTKFASQDEIRRSFKRLAAKWHPDKNTTTEEHRQYAEKMFKDINEANNILSDERKKMIYDNGGHPDDPNSKFYSQEEQNYTNNFYRDASDEKDRKNNENNKGHSYTYSYTNGNNGQSSHTYTNKKRERSNNKYHH